MYCSVLSLNGKVNTIGCHSLTWDPFSHKISIKYSVHRKILCELSKLSKLNAFNLSFTRTLMHLFWFQYERREYATVINFPCLITLSCVYFILYTENCTLFTMHCKLYTVNSADARLIRIVF